jgi:NAD(P)H-dependent flavin oxidoreductase YrpB (nitropropane dioxygenase family)
VSQLSLPVVIQGGMGIGVSSWRLARAVARTGQLGVVSGVGLDTALARRLQDGDPDCDIRRAVERFPAQSMVERVLARYFHPGGRAAGQPYAPSPKLSLHPTRAAIELSVMGNFVEVWLAKEGHEGTIGINYMEKVQMATPAAALGALLAGVDYVLMGAGIPREIPHLLNELAAGREGRITVDVHGSDSVHTVGVDPTGLLGSDLPTMQRPKFLAIVSADMLATYLARDEAIRPDGFVIEGSTAGGHNAPPRGQMTLTDDGQPVYGPRDDANLEKVAALGLPFWLAGGYGRPERLAAALTAGATGVQVGTLFALSRESGLADNLRNQVLGQLDAADLSVRTEASASPTGFPFKVAQLPGTLSEPEVYAGRARLCDLSYLREPYLRPDGDVGFRCPSEPVHMYVRKGGSAKDTVGRVCLCNALTATVGLGQTRKDGYAEAPLVTLGTDIEGLANLRAAYPDGWGAADVVAWLVRTAPAVRVNPTS